MKKGILWISVILFMLVSLKSTLRADEKLAQTGFQFLSVGPIGRASAMGEAYNTFEGGSAALFYNPAGMARMSRSIDLSVSWNSWIADINYNSFSMAYNPKDGLYGAFGLSVLWVDYGEFLGTMVWNNSKGYVDTENFTPKAMAIGFGYAKSLTDKFSVGGQIKYVAQSSGKNVIPDNETKSGLNVTKSVLSTLAYDFGTIYHTGFKSLAFGMSVRNFSEEIKFVQEGFQLPLTFRIGISINAMDFMEQLADKHALFVAIDAVHPRAHYEYINLGFEYKVLDMISLRGGYVTGQDEYDLTYGFGFEKFGLSFDYAYVPFGVFDDVQKITVTFSR